MAFRDDGPSEGQVFEVLGNERRRRALDALRQRRGRATVGELAEDVAAALDRPTERVRESVYNSLRQTHVPHLDRVGVVSYDPVSGEVVLEGGTAVTTHLGTHAGFGVTWAELYRSIALLGLLAALTARLEAPVLGAVGVLPVLTVALLALGGATAVQLWRARWRVLRVTRRRGDGQG